MAVLEHASPPLLCYIKHTRYSIKMRWVKYDQIEKLRKHIIIVFVDLFLQKSIFIALFLRFSVSISAFYTQTSIHTHTHTIFTSVYNNRLRISVHIVLAMYILIFTNIFFTNELINIHVALKYTQKDHSIYSPKINLSVWDNILHWNDYMDITKYHKWMFRDENHWAVWSRWRPVYCDPQ